MLDWPDVRSFSFCSSTTIDELPTRNSTAGVISLKNSATKCAVTEGPRNQRLYDWPFNFERDAGFANTAGNFVVINARQRRLIGKPDGNDTSEIAIGKRANSPLLIRAVLFDQFPVTPTGYCRAER